MEPEPAPVSRRRATRYDWAALGIAGLVGTVAALQGQCDLVGGALGVIGFTVRGLLRLG